MPAAIEEPVTPSPAVPEIPVVPEPRPAAKPSGASPPSPSLVAMVLGPRKPALLAICAACNGLIAPVEVNVFQMLAFGPQVLQKLSNWEFPDEPPVSKPWSSESSELDDAGVAIPCSVPGTEEVNCDSAACALEPVACVLAAACPASAPVVVVCGAVVNDGTLVAVADCAAYPYMAAASCAHIWP